MTRQTTLGSLFLGSLALLGAGCWQDTYAFPTGDDVRMAHADSEAMRSGALAEYGDVYALGMQSAHEVNGWIGEGVDAAGRVIRTLEDLPPTSVDGSWDVYGPYRDPETDKSWLIRIDGDASGSRFEVRVSAGSAVKASDMDALLLGEIEIDGDIREGSFSMNFDTVEAHELKAGPDRDRSYRGTVEIQFERDLSSDLKLVDITYEDFEVTQEYPIKEYFSADSYSFRRNERGAGAFHLDIMSTFQAQVWSGPQRERMVLDLAWNETGAGTGKGQVLELEGEGDLAYGDIILDECFDESGYFTWRQLSDAYAQAFPAYAAGDPSTCVKIDDDVPAFGQ
jgi:hypothetical protein